MKTSPFAVYEQALMLRAQRNEILSSNLANADTPNYKARDFDFASALRGAQAASPAVTRTSDLHMAGLNTNRLGAEVQYRLPMQSSLDGNTVETDVEQAAFAENAVQYRAALSFLDGKIRTLRYALKGGE
ncbi:MAG: flagellar basal body rod protein FlgB [Gammaproteobacteria bacterium]|nr:flagellar basal body rod protein FlgB [Gammaproteobacteria bacterium]